MQRTQKKPTKPRQNIIKAPLVKAFITWKSVINLHQIKSCEEKGVGDAAVKELKPPFNHLLESIMPYNDRWTFLWEEEEGASCIRGGVPIINLHVKTA